MARGSPFQPGNQAGKANSHYRDDAAEEILDRLAEGERLKDICQDAHLPAYATVLKWAQRDVEGFRARFDEARKAHVWRKYEEATERIENAIEAADPKSKAYPQLFREYLHNVHWGCDKAGFGKPREGFQQNPQLTVAMIMQRAAQQEGPAPVLDVSSAEQIDNS